MTELLPIKQIKQSSSLQPRAKMDTGKIDEYTEAMRRGDAFPAVIVYRVGGDLFLVDGYHRFMAAQGAKLDKILAEVRAGTMREAILISAGVNATHGIQRSNEDKHRAVMILLRDKEWGQWNDTKIAETCHVSPELVGKIRKSILPISASATPEKKKVERAGKVIKMDTSKIGKNQKKPAPATTEFHEHVPPAECTVPLKGDPDAPCIKPLGASIRAGEMAAAGQNQQQHVNPGAICTVNPVVIDDSKRQAPEPAPWTTDTCKTGPCPDGKLHATLDKVRGICCDLTGQPVNQISACAYLERQRKETLKGFTTGSRLDAAVPLMEHGPLKIVPVKVTAEQAGQWITAIVRGYLTKSSQGTWEAIRKTGEMGDTDLEIFQGLIDNAGERVE